MKTLLLPLLLLIISCSKPIDEESLVQRNGVYYKVNSETPYMIVNSSHHMIMARERMRGIIRMEN